jgi:uncharacterized protein (UPF0333 family)
MDNRAQISAELLIIMAAIAGFAILVVNALMSNTESMTGKLSDKTDSLLDEIDKIGEKANSS